MTHFFYSLLFLTSTVAWASQLDDDHINNQLQSPAFINHLNQAHKTLKEAKTFSEVYAIMVRKLIDSKPTKQQYVEHGEYYKKNNLIIDLLSHAADRITENRTMVERLLNQIEKTKTARTRVEQQLELEEHERLSLLDSMGNTINLIAYNALLNTQETKQENALCLFSNMKKELKKTKKTTRQTQMQIHEELELVKLTLENLLTDDEGAKENQRELLSQTISTFSFSQAAALRYIAMRKLTSFHDLETKIFLSTFVVNYFFTFLSQKMDIDSVITRHELNSHDEQLTKAEKAMLLSIKRFEKLKSKKDEVDALCACCGLQATAYCGRCSLSGYCSKECQTKDWSSHKKLCNFDPHRVFFLGSGESLRCIDSDSNELEVEELQINDLTRTYLIDAQSEKHYCLIGACNKTFAYDAESKKMYEVSHALLQNSLPS